MKLRHLRDSDADFRLSYDFDSPGQPFLYNSLRPWLVIATIGAGVMATIPGSAGAFCLPSALSTSQSDALRMFGDIEWRDALTSDARCGDAIADLPEQTVIFPSSREALEIASYAAWIHDLCVVDHLDGWEVLATIEGRSGLLEFIKRNLICRISGSYGDSSGDDFLIEILQPEHREAVRRGIEKAIVAYNL